MAGFRGLLELVARWLGRFVAPAPVGPCKIAQGQVAVPGQLAGFAYSTGATTGVVHA